MKDIKKEFNNNSKIVPVILAGGIGSRLWPLSRASYPKQFLKLDEANNFSMLQNTYLRINGIKHLDAPIIICNEEHRFIVAEQMREIEIKPKSIILEPVSRNTAPAIALASLKILEEEKNDSILLILSADHLIKDTKSFKKAIQIGLKFAQDGRLVTFGINPTRPETGYGYIESFEEINSTKKFSNIKSFIEKPNKDLAKHLIEDNHFTWNSGIFMFKSSVIINEIKKYHPSIINLCMEALQDKTNDLDFQRINKEQFKACKDISIDIAVMEKTKLGTVIDLNAQWSDIGNWKTIWEKSKKDNMGNKEQGKKTLLKDCKNCYLRSENRLTIGLGIEEIAVIETRDAVLVANINKVQNIKEMVTELESRNIKEGKENSIIFRPWGNFTTIEDEKNWKVKKLEIKPGAYISLQLHKHRSEHWVVVSGVAKAEVGKKITFLKENESIYVPKGSKHRLSNPKEKTLVLIEVQSGDYLDEDDIIRFKDNYGRL